MTDASAGEQIRRDFAVGWGRIGAAWGVTPSTATEPKQRERP